MGETKEAEDSPKVKRLKTEIHVYKYVKWKRMLGYVLFVLWMPIVIPIHLCLIAYAFLFNAKQHRTIKIYLKYYFKHYFYVSGIKTIDIYPIPKTTKKPSIFFAVRNVDLVTPYLATQLPIDVALPYKKGLSKLPLHLFFPFFQLGPFVTSLGYPDSSLPESIGTIRQLLKQKKSILIYINPDFCTASIRDTLSIHMEILDLLDLDIPSYFVSSKGLEFYRSGTLFNPAIIRTVCMTSDDLFEGLTPGPSLRPERCLRIMTLFNFKKVEVV